MRHLNEEELIDIAEGTWPERSLPHLAACDICGKQIADLRAMLSAAAEVEVPEPSPLFWEHLSARVRDRVASANEEHASFSGRMTWRFMVPALALAGVVLAAVVTLRGPSPAGPSSATGGSPLAASLVDDIVPLADDASLNLIADLASDLDWDAAAEAGLTTRTGAAERILMEMSADERLELQRILKQELSGKGA